MCQKCKDTLDKYLPDLSDEEKANVLMSWTAFPAGDHNIVSKQIRKYSRNPARYKKYVDSLINRVLKEKRDTAG